MTARAITDLAGSPLQAVRAWRRFANGISFTFRGETRTWAQHVRTSSGYVDEDALIRPYVFPRFAEELLGFSIGQNLAAEHAEAGQTPDFTPADAVTHDFVFEIKSTRAGVGIAGFDQQVERYLTIGRPRIRRVVLTNLAGLHVYHLNGAGRTQRVTSISLVGLLRGAEEVAGGTRDAREFAAFLRDYSFKQLGSDEKLARVRQAPEWNPGLEVTNPDWLSRRLLRVVEILQADVKDRIGNGALENDALMGPPTRTAIADELRELEWRLGGNWEEARTRTLASYLASGVDTAPGRAVAQYVAHTAYFATTRLVLVRVWEDLDLLQPVLYDGGFNRWMRAFEDVVRRVIAYSFREAGSRYPALFSRDNNYTWYLPSDEAYANAIYELANTYFGAIRSDVLGDVYETLLERVDRKNIGQFYTPRDVIALIWDLIDFTQSAQVAEAEDREFRVLDIATGSAGFLVDAANRLRGRFDDLTAAGAAINIQTFVQRLAHGLVGVEVQRFPAYLAELNVLVQIAPLLAKAEDVPVPPLGILCADTLSLHEPVQLFEERGEHESLLADPLRAQLYDRVKDVAGSGFAMDVACGNPPYVGETRGAAMMQRTRERFPYWNQFVAPHLDYLYWFLILGISKLRSGGRFGFITTEYWLRSDGGRQLRDYIARRCRVDRILLFRDMRLFPDAPGQHSMVIIGQRVVPGDAELGGGAYPVERSYPLVSVYSGPNLYIRDRAAILDVFRAGGRRADVATFRARASPNELGGGSWAEVVLTAQQLARRRRMLERSRPLEMRMEEGVIATPDRMRSVHAEELPERTLREIGWPERRHGIFILTPEEVRGLGPLSPEERRVLRSVVNTRDVFPYATVLPREVPTMLYLAPPERDGPASSLARIQGMDFPTAYPALKRHLERFKPLLAKRVQDWGERRPWWSVHRARPNVIGRDSPEGRWADYALTTRWGGGGRLLVGLAPRGTVPASGLHAILPAAPASAAYVVALFNSSAVQGLAEQLPPAELRQEDLSDLGLPLLEAHVDTLAAHALTLAERVVKLVSTHGARWPSLPADLREDVSLATVSTDAWLPQVGPQATWGPLPGLPWIAGVEAVGAQARKISDVTTEHDLFGPSIVAEGGPSTIRLRVASEDDALIEALKAYVTGLQTLGVPLRGLTNFWGPVDAEELVGLYQADLATLGQAAAGYRDLRAEIDAVVEAAI